MKAPQFPPLLQGLATADDPFEVATAMARDGCDAGLVVHNLNGDNLRAAMIFAPEVPLASAMAMLPVCGVGFQNALGAVAPPEVAVHLTWQGEIRVNGATCGGLRIRAPDADATEIPDWLIVGLEVPLWPATDNPGETPDRTALYAEGSSDIAPVDLLESWARHSLLWISRWMDEGPAPLHAELAGLLHKPDGFVGLDENLGLLRKNGNRTILTPLTSLLETT